MSERYELVFSIGCLSLQKGDGLRDLVRATFKLPVPYREDVLSDCFQCEWALRKSDYDTVLESGSVMGPDPDLVLREASAHAERALSLYIEKLEKSEGPLEAVIRDWYRRLLEDEEHED